MPFDYANLPKVAVGPNDLLVGESTIPRNAIASSSVTSGGSSLRLTYFTASKTENVSSVRVITGGTAAAATPTLCRIGIYAVGDNGDLTLIASTPNDTTLFAAASTVYTKALSAPFVKYKGLRYAVGILVVSGVATPSFQGNNSVPASEAAIAPRMVGYSAQTDLPATITEASLSAGTNQFYVALI